jgi:large subunit ribosomal protein L35
MRRLDAGLQRAQHAPALSPAPLATRSGHVRSAGLAPRPARAHLLQLLDVMPKMKTHSGAKKRFRKTAGGKLRGRHAFTTHILGKKSSRRKRRLSRPVVISPANKHEVRDLLAGKGRK